MEYGLYKNATAQYLDIEKKLLAAQKRRDELLKSLSNRNANLNTLKLNIEDILNSFEFKERVYESTSSGKDKFIDKTSLFPQSYKEIVKGLKFDSAKGQLLTNDLKPISEPVAFLDIEGRKLTVLRLTDTWKSLRKTLLDSLKSYKKNLNEISSINLALDDLQKVIDGLKKDLGDAAKNDPALLKAKEEAESREREAKIKADAEAEQLRITTEATQRQRQSEQKEKNKKLLIYGALALALVGIYLFTRKK